MTVAALILTPPVQRYDLFILLSTDDELGLLLTLEQKLQKGIPCGRSSHTLH